MKARGLYLPETPKGMPMMVGRMLRPISGGTTEFHPETLIVEEGEALMELKYG